MGRHSRWPRPRSRLNSRLPRARRCSSRFDRHHLPTSASVRDMGRAAADHHAIGLPGVGDGAQAVRVSQGVARSERVALAGGGVVDGDAAGGASLTLATAAVAPELTTSSVPCRRCSSLRPSSPCRPRLRSGHRAAADHHAIGLPGVVMAPSRPRQPVLPAVSVSPWLGVALSWRRRSVVNVGHGRGRA